MNLRPHHILCIQKFTGHGYNADFTAHMNSIVTTLSDNPKVQITITHGCDDLCRLCPNRINDTCTSLEKVAAMDNAVLNVCNLAYGENAPWTDLASKAQKQIFETDEFRRICTCCQWFELCKCTETLK